MLKWLRNLFSKLLSGGSKIPSYEIVDRGIEELSAFKITSGKYTGVVYLVGKVAFKETNNGYNLSFCTQILENPKNYKLDTDAKFTSISGDILSEFMKQQADDYNNWLYLKGEQHG